MTNTELDSLKTHLALYAGAYIVIDTPTDGFPYDQRRVSITKTLQDCSRLIEDAELLNSLIAILQDHCGERDTNESAVETLQRIIRERDEAVRSQGYPGDHAIFQERNPMDHSEEV